MDEKEIRFEDCYKRNFELLYRIAYVYLRNNADVHDVLQDVFMKYLKCDNFIDADAEKRWLIRVVANACKDRYRCFWKRNVVAIEVEDVTATNSVQYSWLWDLIGKLHPKYRIVIHLYYYLGYSTKEIALILQLSESNIKQRLKRAREKLKIELEE